MKNSIDGVNYIDKVSFNDIISNYKSKTRGFEIVDDKFRKIDDPIMPLRKTQYSAGYDFFAPYDFYLPPFGKEVIHTDIKAYMLEDEVLKIYIRSSIGIKRNCRLKNGVGIIDADYSHESNQKSGGNIIICIENNSKFGVNFKRGQGIAQGVFEQYLVADNCNSDEIREGGIGSTN